MESKDRTQEARTQEDLPPAVAGLEGESDVVAARSGMKLRRTPRPIPADLVELSPDPVEADEEETAEKGPQDARPETGPTG